MAIVEDPEGNETITLHRMVDITDRRVLEIGCGEGRLTWRYADVAEHVTAIDPIAEEIKAAQANLADQLKGRVTFAEATIEGFAESNREARFEIAIFAWSL